LTSQTQQLKGLISTSQIGLKRKIAERFEVFNIDEFRTSKLHYKTETVCKNPYIQANPKEERGSSDTIQQKLPRRSYKLSAKERKGLNLRSERQIKP